MFDLFSDPVKVAQQLEIIASEYGFAADAVEAAVEEDGGDAETEQEA